jgi:putative oxidoreductase
MKTINQNSSVNTSVIPAIGRVLMAAIFIFGGIGKIFAPAATVGYIQSSGLPMASVAFVIAIAIEVGGGTMLALGIKTRLVAAGLAVFCIVTGLAFHNAIGDQNQFAHLLKNIAMAGGLLQIVAFGASAYSLDAIEVRKTLSHLG